MATVGTQNLHTESSPASAKTAKHHLPAGFRSRGKNGVLLSD